MSSDETLDGTLPTSVDGGGGTLLPKTRSYDDLMAATEGTLPPLTRRLSDPNIASDPSQCLQKTKEANRIEINNDTVTFVNTKSSESAELDSVEAQSNSDTDDNNRDGKEDEHKEITAAEEEPILCNGEADCSEEEIMANAMATEALVSDAIATADVSEGGEDITVMDSDRDTAEIGGGSTEDLTNLTKGLAVDGSTDTLTCEVVEPLPQQQAISTSTSWLKNVKLWPKRPWRACLNRRPAIPGSLLKDCTTRCWREAPCQA